MANLNGAGPTVAVPFALVTTETFGQRLKRLRLRRQWTQVQLARQAGLKKAVISLWENDERLPAKRNLQRMAAALGVSAEQLLGGADRRGAGGTARTLEPAISPPRMPGDTSKRATATTPVVGA